MVETSLAVQWLRLRYPMQGGAGSIRGQKTKIFATCLVAKKKKRHKNVKEKEYCNKFNKIWKIIYIKKSLKIFFFNVD